MMITFALMGKVIKIPSVEVIDTKVVGVSKENSDGTSRQQIIREAVKEDDVVLLKEDESNHYDPNAVCVLSEEGQQIGYLPKEVAPRVKSAIQNEAQIICKASWVSGEKYVGVGLRIELIS